MKSLKKCGISGPWISTHATDTAPPRIRCQPQNLFLCIGGLVEICGVTDVDSVFDVSRTQTASGYGLEVALERASLTAYIVSYEVVFKL